MLTKALSTISEKQHYHADRNPFWDNLNLLLPQRLPKTEVVPPIK